MKKAKKAVNSKSWQSVFGVLVGIRILLTLLLAVFHNRNSVLGYKSDVAFAFPLKNMHWSD